MFLSCTYLSYAGPTRVLNVSKGIEFYMQNFLANLYDLLYVQLEYILTKRDCGNQLTLYESIVRK